MTVLRSTAYRSLEQIGLYARRNVRCVQLTTTHYRMWLAWSLACSLILAGLPMENSRYHQENIIERRRFSGAGLLVWGDILGSRTDLYIPIGTMTEQIYRNVILKQHRHFCFRVP
ncbi:transposable element Tcb1 transposase [Trichonephila clavipes]|nr:transposable element Tcb1 transposase [Trichonephila clavipes]